MKVRKTTIKDFQKILSIYAYARQQMKLTGNPDQWGDDHPPETVIITDIEKGNSYVIEDNHQICGVFAFIIGDEPAYQIIEGKWLNDKPYGTIHRVASNGTKKGILYECLKFCQSQFPNTRIDTYHDNKIMQHLLEKYGYTKCGIVHLADGSPRIGYQKTR